MPKKVLPKSPLELRYEKIDPKPQFPLQTYKTILSAGIKIGEYTTFWRDKKPSCQQFMRSLHPNCEMCGKDSSGGSLDVHHLKWDRKHDCTYDNLFVICRSCHTKIHRRGDGWFPSKPWAKEWGDVPQGLIDRNHLDKDGNIAGVWLNIVQTTDIKSTNESSSEHKSKASKRSRKAATVSA